MGKTTKQTRPLVFDYVSFVREGAGFFVPLFAVGAMILGVVFASTYRLRGTPHSRFFRL